MRFDIVLFKYFNGYFRHQDIKKLPLINENKHSDVDPNVLNLKWYGAKTIHPQNV